MSGAVEPQQAAAKPVENVAARWLVRRHEGLNRREEDEFVAWLAADTVHKQAYDNLAHGWAALDAMAAIPQVSALRSEALVANPPRPVRAARWMAVAAVFLFALLLGAGAVLLENFGEGQSQQMIAGADNEIRTVKGERLTRMLPDGSTVTLNTDTHLRLAYTGQERHITLVEGQAYFQVAHEKARPFVVSAGGREIIAVGTEFEVRVERDKVAIALVEGRVKVRPSGGNRPSNKHPAPAMLEPGEQLIFAPTGVDTSIKVANVADLVRWREGQVRFDAVPLAQAVAEMNRYNGVPIVIKDPDLQAIEISGVFQTGQSKNFVEALTQIFPVTANVTGSEIQIHALASPSRTKNIS